MGSFINVFSVQLNIFKDISTEFVNEYTGNTSMHYIAKLIVQKLLMNHDTYIRNAQHPFHLYGAESDSLEQSIRKLENDIIAEIPQNTTLTNYLHSFFSSSGANYESVKSYLTKFTDFADICIEAYNNETLNESNDSEW